jgi:hypothetical protein
MATQKSSREVVRPGLIKHRKWFFNLEFDWTGKTAPCEYSFREAYRKSTPTSASSSRAGKKKQRFHSANPPSRMKSKAGPNTYACLECRRNNNIRKFLIYTRTELDDYIL